MQLMQGSGLLSPEPQRRFFLLLFDYYFINNSSLFSLFTLDGVISNVTPTELARYRPVFIYLFLKEIHFSFYGRFG